MRARHLVRLPRHPDDRRAGEAASRPTASRSALHLNTRCSDFTRRQLEDQLLTSQLVAFAAAWPSVSAAGLQPHALRRLERLGHGAEGREGQRHPLRHELLLQRPGRLADEARPAHRLRLPAALRRPRRLDDRRLPGDDPGHRRESEIANALAGGHAARQRARLRRATTAPSPSSPHTDYGDHTNANTMVSAAQERGVPVVCSGADARLARRPQRLVVRRHRLQRRAAHLLRRHEPEGARPRGDAARAVRHGPAVASCAATAQPVVVGPAHRQGRGLHRLQGRCRRLHRHLRDRRRPRRRSRPSTPRPTPRATRRSPGPRTSRPARASSTAAPPRSAARSATPRGSPSTASSSRAWPPAPPTLPRDARPTPRATAGASATPGARDLPAGALVDTRHHRVRRRHAVREHLRGRDGRRRPTARSARSRAVGEEFEGTALPAGWAATPWYTGGFTTVVRRPLLADGAAAMHEHARSARAARSSSARPSGPSTTRPSASATTSATTRSPPSAPAATAAVPAVRAQRRQPRQAGHEEHAARRRRPVRPAPLPDRVERDDASSSTSTARSVRDAHRRDRRADAPGGVATTGSSAPASRCTGCARAATRPRARSPRACSTAARAPASGRPSRPRPTLPAGTGIDLRDALGRHADAGRELVGVAERRRRRRHRQPGRPLHPVPRAPDAHDAATTPTLKRVQITRVAGTDRAPMPGTVSIAPAAPTTNQDVTATPERLQRPRRRPAHLPLPVAAATARRSPGATTDTLNLALAGNGDRGDKVRVEVYATDGRGAASDAAIATGHGGQHGADGRHRGGQAGAAVDQRRGHRGAERLRRPRRRARSPTATSGSATTPPITGATSRTLDLSLAGNGDSGDRIDVDVTAVDGGGATSPAARGGQNITGTNSTPVEGTVAARAGLAEDQPDADGHADAASATRTATRSPTATGGCATARRSPARPRTLNLAPAGNGDRGDTISVEVTATDNLNAAQRRRHRHGHRGQHRARRRDREGQARRRPRPTTSSPPPPAGFADADGDAVTLPVPVVPQRHADRGAARPHARPLRARQRRPRRHRRGRDPRARRQRRHELDASAARRRSPRSNSNAVASYGFEEAAGTVAVDDAAATTARSPARRASTPAASAARCPSTARTTSSPSPTRRRST